MKTYREKLNDPRWQKLRLEVFQRDGFECQSCTAKDKPLHVHHTTYHGEPWESPPDELLTMCEDCHENVETVIKMVRENAHIRALPHIINRVIMLEGMGANEPEKLLRHTISLCEQADDRAAEI